MKAAFATVMETELRYAAASVISMPLPCALAFAVGQSANVTALLSQSCSRAVSFAKRFWMLKTFRVRYHAPEEELCGVPAAAMKCSTVLLAGAPLTYLEASIT